MVRETSSSTAIFGSNEDDLTEKRDSLVQSHLLALILHF